MAWYFKRDLEDPPLLKLRRNGREQRADSFHVRSSVSQVKQCWRDRKISGPATEISIPLLGLTPKEGWSQKVAPV